MSANPQRILPGMVPGLDLMGPAAVEAYLKQFTEWNFKLPLTLDDYFWRSEQLRAAITTSATTGTVTYRTPANFNGLLFEIQGHLAFNAVTTETQSIAGIGNPGILERIALKAMNSRIALQNVDRGWKLFSTADKPLSSILSILGGKPLVFNPPYILSDGEALQMDITSQDTAASVIGGSTNVGLDLIALFVRVRP